MGYWRETMENGWATFWRLLEESIIVQSSVTLIAVCVTAYMVLCGKDVPKEWWTIIGIIIGFWFGSKVQIAEKVARRDTAEAIDQVVRHAREH